jgi:hypothetical protein
MPGLVKLAVALAIGGALAGVIAWGAQSSAGGSDDGSPAAQVAASVTRETPTPMPEATKSAPSAIQPFVSPNLIPPDQAALDEVTQDQAALAASGERCPPSWLLYESQLLGGSFCYPPTWEIARGDGPVLPVDQRPDGYAYALLVIKNDPSTARELARLSIQITGDLRARPLDCPEPGTLAAGPLVGKVCFQERKNDNYNSVPAGSARIVVVALPHRLPDFLETRMSYEIADETPDLPTVRFSRQDQREALGIIASVQFKNP